jgi:hypothetical protein
MQKAREPVLEELKADLSAIKTNAAKGSLDLLEHIYTFHPQYGREWDWTVEIKKQLQNAIRHYHPDKSANSDPKWVVLSER